MSTTSLRTALLLTAALAALPSLGACGDDGNPPADAGDVPPDGPDETGSLDGDAEAEATDAPDGEEADAFEGYVWPNDESRANSDPWIAEHHAAIREMRPRVLALNFVNAKTNEQMRAQLEEAIAALEESSRSHGYDDPWAPAFLRYEIAYAVDLRDDPPPADWPYRNSTSYPREAPPTGTWGFDYERLFSREFADRYAIDDPDDPGRHLDLCELVDRGLVHEVWVYGDADVPDVGAAEVLAVKPYYDEANRRRTERPLNRCAGNGCFDDDDVLPEHCTRTLSIAWFNNTRGPGCFVESHSHAFESMAAWNPTLLPYLSRHFIPFALYDLDDRYGLPFESWYLCPYDGSDCLSYPTETSAAYRVEGLTGTLDPYDPVCGNVHFPPNARRHYDLEGPATVQTTCEGYRLGEGPGGADLARPFSRSRFRYYERLAPDCMGAFLLYWRQSFPGLDNRARDDAGEPLLNWWPFLYY